MIEKLPTLHIQKSQTHRIYIYTASFQYRILCKSTNYSAFYRLRHYTNQIEWVYFCWKFSSTFEQILAIFSSSSFRKTLYFMPFMNWWHQTKTNTRQHQTAHTTKSNEKQGYEEHNDIKWYRYGKAEFRHSKNRTEKKPRLKYLRAQHETLDFSTEVYNELNWSRPRWVSRVNPYTYRLFFLSYSALLYWPFISDTVRTLTVQRTVRLVWCAISSHQIYILYTPRWISVCDDDDGLLVPSF